MVLWNRHGDRDTAVQARALFASQAEIAAARAVRAAALALISRLDAGLDADPTACAEAVDALRTLLLDKVRMFDRGRPLSMDVEAMTAVCDRYLARGADPRSALMTCTRQLAVEHGIEEEEVQTTGGERPGWRPAEPRPVERRPVDFGQLVSWAMQQRQVAELAAAPAPVLEWAPSVAPAWPEVGARDAAAPVEAEVSWTPAAIPEVRTPVTAAPAAVAAVPMPVAVPAPAPAARPARVPAFSADGPPPSGAPAVRMASKLRREGDLAGARIVLQRPLADGDDDIAAAATLELGRVLRAQGETAQAKAAYRSAMASGCTATVGPAGLYLGLLLSEEGDLDGAEAAFRRSATSGDRLAVMWSIAQLGLLAVDRGDLDGATRIWRNGRAAGHDLGRALVGIGRVLAADDHAEAAVAAWREARESSDERAATEATAELSARGLMPPPSELA